MKQILLAISLIGSLETSALAHLFTDTAGRRVEADLVGLRGENVVLQVNEVRGQWPLKQLSAADQAYVLKWKTENSGIDKVQVRAFEKSGMGPQGEFPTGKGTPAAAPPLPATTTQTTYQHYEVEVTNPSKVDASMLRVEYILYVLNPDGSVGANAGEHTLSGLKAGAAQKLATHGQTAKKTKTSVLKLNYNNQTGLSVTEKNARSKERFGGVWIKVKGVDGSVIGETKKLLPELEKANPEWTEMAVKEDIPVLKSLADLLELLKNAIPNAPKTGGPGPLPKLPIGR